MRKTFKTFDRFNAVLINWEIRLIMSRLFLNYFMQHNLGPERLDRGPRREEEVRRRGQSMIFERGRQFGTAKKDLKSSSMQSICSLTV